MLETIRRPCTTPGCPQYQPCATHSTPTHRDTKTDEERKFYSSYRWTQASKRHRHYEPTCRECKKNGKTRAGTMVDHIIPIRSGIDPWDETNWQTLCHRCHQKKRAAERWCFWRYSESRARIRKSKRNSYFTMKDFYRNGKTRAGTMVDHIIPIRSGIDPWDETNWQTLCHRCHQKKRAAERNTRGSLISH